jgi:hypothetical protein
MPKYIMANVRIPVEISNSGKFTLINKYTKIEISELESLPPEGEDTLNNKITEYLTAKKEKEELELDRIRRQQIENERIQKEEFEKYKREKEDLEKMKLAELEKIRKEKEDFEKYKIEHMEAMLKKETDEKFLKISKNDMKMRKHTNVVSFKNLKGSGGTLGSRSYTRKSYDQVGLSPL